VKFLKRLILLVILGGLFGFGIFLLRDLTPPTVEVAPAAGPLSPQRPLKLTLTDKGLGLRTLQVTLLQGDKSVEVLTRSYPAGSTHVEETLDLSSAHPAEGPARLTIRAVDWGHFHFGRGNAAERTLAFDIDSKPPEVEILTPHHNLNQGGAGMVAYTVSEEVESSGVQVGDLFFPGYRQPSGKYLCLFAFPWDMKAADFVPKVIATDLAGNQRMTGIYYHTNPRNFPSDRIKVTDSFLENKIVPTFQSDFPGTTAPLDLYLKVNRDLRRQNLATLRQIGARSAATRLWQGALLRQPKAAAPGSFAQPRTYYYQGRVIDHETHLGIDFASVAQAPVLAAATGKVVHADRLGIYGNCIIIDHGLGMQTLYGHLSRIEVKVGDSVSRGQEIGRTGSTGLAGGDHLHFDVLASGIQVNPIEWFDDHWLKDNIQPKLQQAEH
jgi:murein DD-endopeptidase MepM/ murein hydrolase activator NlpD